MHSKWVAIIIGITASWAIPGEIYIPWEGWVPYAASAGMVLALAFLFKRIQFVSLIILSLIYGSSFLVVSRNHFFHSAWRQSAKEIVISGEVRSFPKSSYGGWKFEMRMTEFRMMEDVWRKANSKVEVFVRSCELPPLIGDRLIIKGKIKFPSPNEPGADWLRHYLFHRGLSAQIRVKNDGQMLHAGVNHLYFPVRLLQLIRESLSARIEKKFSSEQAMVMQSLLLGVRMQDPMLYKIFTRTGTVHLLSVSGFHTSVIAGVMVGIALIFRLKPQASVIFASFGTLAYMLLTGWEAAVQRAGLMAIAAWIAWILGRPQQLIYWLNAVAALMLWMNPLMLGSISFQLSFLAMYGILLIPERLPFFIRKVPGFDISCAAFLATYPVILFHFQTFAWAGLFANLIVVPIFALILPLGFLTLLPVFHWIFLPIVKSLLTISLFLLKGVSGIDWTVLQFPQPSVFALGAYYAFGGLILWLGRPRGELRSRPALLSGF